MGIDEERLCKQCKNPLPEWADIRMVYCPACSYLRQKERTKAEREYLIEKGLCVRCRKAKAVEGRTMCPDCLEQTRQYNRQRKKPPTPARANGSKKYPEESISN